MRKKSIIQWTERVRAGINTSLTSSEFFFFVDSLSIKWRKKNNIFPSSPQSCWTITLAIFVIECYILIKGIFKLKNKFDKKRRLFVMLRVYTVSYWFDIESKREKTKLGELCPCHLVDVVKLSKNERQRIQKGTDRSLFCFSCWNEGIKI